MTTLYGDSDVGFKVNINSIMVYKIMHLIGWLFNVCKQFKKEFGTIGNIYVPLIKRLPSPNYLPQLDTIDLNLN